MKGELIVGQTQIGVGALRTVGVVLHKAHERFQGARRALFAGSGRVLLPERFCCVISPLAGGGAASFNYVAKGLERSVVIFCSLVIATFRQQEALVPLRLFAHAIGVALSSFATLFNALKAKQCQRVLAVN